MKGVLKSVALFLFISIVILVFGIVSCSAFYSPDKNGVSYLVVGFDDAAENTDVISIVNFGRKDGNINIFQIPRDTYFNFGKTNNKINSFYASKRASGISGEKALKDFRCEIEKVFQVRLGGAFGISTSAFSALVDFVGGVSVNLGEDLSIRSSSGEVLLNLSAGENLLCGADALIFVRHRFGYPLGDLDRMDAQKLFFKGALEAIIKNGNYPALLARILREKGITADFSVSELLPALLEIKRRDSVTVNSVTLPGEAVKVKSGAWYYILNRRGNLELFANVYGDLKREFDPEHKLSDVENVEFEKIYNKNSVK